ncbi:MAG: toprim domain-containing protein [Pseudomonadota bacterium]
MSAVEAITDFIHTMEIEGVKAIEPIAQRLSSGDLIRFRCEGDGKGRLNGWAILYLDERPAGAFGNYRLGVSRKWKSGDDRQLSPEERRRLQAEWNDAKQKRLDEKLRCEREAAVEAQEMWRAGHSASVDHPYVAKKGLDTIPLRQIGAKLLVPMYDGSGALWNLQRIDGDGSKRFMRGGRVDGLFAIIGSFERRGERACIGEGYATMAAVHRSTGHPCIVAFSAKNIAAVARLWADARPDLDFVICADDDAHLDRNIGIEAAEAAAQAIGARVATPLRRAS